MLSFWSPDYIDLKCQVVVVVAVVGERFQSPMALPQVGGDLLQGRSCQQADVLMCQSMLGDVSMLGNRQVKLWDHWDLFRYLLIFLIFHISFLGANTGNLDSVRNMVSFARKEITFSCVFHPSEALRVVYRTLFAAVLGTLVKLA